MSPRGLGHRIRKNGILKCGGILSYTFDAQDVADHQEGYLSGDPLPVDIHTFWPIDVTGILPSMRANPHLLHITGK